MFWLYQENQDFHYILSLFHFVSTNICAYNIYIDRWIRGTKQCTITFFFWIIFLYIHTTLECKSCKHHLVREYNTPIIPWPKLCFCFIIGCSNLKKFGYAYLRIKILFSWYLLEFYRVQRLMKLCFDFQLHLRIHIFIKNCILLSFILLVTRQTTER